jgi:hypothetical protein
MQVLLAQVNNRRAGNDDIPPEVAIIAVVVGLVLIAIGLAVTIFFLLTLSKTLGRCRPTNRTMEPGMVWLNLVPCLSIAWQFVTVIRVAESLDNEFYDRGIGRRGDDYGKGLGITACVLNLLGVIPYLGLLFSLGGLVCGIIYWVKIAGYNTQMATRVRNDDDDRDDRPWRKGRRDDEFDNDWKNL